MPRRKHRRPAAGCRRIDRKNGIVVCRRCRYYRPLNEALALGYACHYSLDTGQLRGSCRPVPDQDRTLSRVADLSEPSQGFGTDVTGRIDEILDSSGADRDDDGSVIAARSVNRDGPSRAYLGGRSVPAKSLSTFTNELLALHGQNDQLPLTLHPQRGEGGQPGIVH